MPSVETTNISKAGITTSSTGERHIPSSVRPDGTLRKEIRVRPGYRPPEDVEVYKNRTAEGFRNRGGKAGVPGAESLKAEDDVNKSGSAANKNAKRREARKKAAAAATDGKDELEVEDIKEQDEEPAKLVEPVKVVDPEAEKEKEAKKLTKKLRQARELMDKKEKGDKLLPEQFEKVIKINELIRQLESLGFDAQGEKKTDP